MKNEKDNCEFKRCRFSPPVSMVHTGINGRHVLVNDCDNARMCCAVGYANNARTRGVENRASYFGEQEGGGFKPPLYIWMRAAHPA